MSQNLDKIKEEPPPPDKADKKFSEGFDKTHVSKKEFKDHQKEFNFQKKILNWTFGFVVAILLVCFITMFTFMLDAWKLHTDREKEYMETVKEIRTDNEVKMETLNKKMFQLECAEHLLKKDSIH